MFYDSGWLYGELPNKIASTRCYQKMKCQKCLFFVFFSQTVFLGKHLFPDRNSWNSDFIRIQIVFRRIDYSLSQCVKHARSVVVCVFFSLVSNGHESTADSSTTWYTHHFIGNNGIQVENAPNTNSVLRSTHLHIK